jgi:2-haloacid dehalogenase
MEDFLSTVCTPAWNDRLDRGLPFADGVAELTRRFPDQAELIAAYHDRWPEMLGGPVEGTADVVAELRAAGVPVYGLSNWSTETYPVGRDRFAVLETLDGLLLSGEVGVAKPDPEIFEELCARFGLRPEATLFVDDSAANVEGAARLGFPVHHFRDAGALRADLVARGLLP